MRDRVVARDGALAVRPLLTACLCWDSARTHPRTAAAFLATLAALAADFRAVLPALGWTGAP